jgi:hypothetical protein
MSRHRHRERARPHHRRPLYEDRIMALLSLPHASIDRMALDHLLKAIGKLEGTTAKTTDAA